MLQLGHGATNPRTSANVVAGGESQGLDILDSATWLGLSGRVAHGCARGGEPQRIILGCSTRLGGREEAGKGRAGPEGASETGRVREPRGRRQTRREMKNTRVAAFWSGRHGTFSTPRTPKRSRRRVIRCAFPVPRNSRAPRGGLGPDGRGRGRHGRAGSTPRRSTPIRARPSRRPCATP